MSDKNNSAEAFNQIAMPEIEDHFYSEDSVPDEGEVIGQTDDGDDADEAHFDSADDGGSGGLTALDVEEAVSYQMHYVVGGNPDAEPAMKLFTTRVPMVGELMRFHINVKDELRINSFIYNQYSDLNGIYQVAMVITEHTLSDHNDENIHYTVLLEDVTAQFADDETTSEDEVQPGESDA